MTCGLTKLVLVIDIGGVSWGMGGLFTSSVGVVTNISVFSFGTYDHSTYFIHIVHTVKNVAFWLF